MRNNRSRKWSRRTHFGFVSPRTRGTLLAIAFAAFIGLISPSELHAQKYKVIFLGTFGGDQTAATAINDLDDVVGYSQLPGDSTQHAFLYRNGKLIDLDPNPKEDVGGSRANGINHYGQIVGFVGNAQTTYAFLYQRGTLTNLSGPTAVSLAFGINDLGEVVGISTAVATGAFLYRNGNMTAIAPGFSPLAINNLGQIVGYTAHAVLYQNGLLLDLGTLGGSTSQAWAINNIGQIVGFSLTATGEEHSFLYDNGVMKDLGGGGASIAQGINDNGEVVGQGTDANRIPFAFLYTSTKGLVNLNNYVVNLSNGTTTGFMNVANASSINKQGDIAGLGNYFNGTKTIQAGFLLKRISK
jgi:probable HAF family extracellular repeat protein